MFPYLLHGFYSGADLGYMSLKTVKNTHSESEYFQPQKEYIERDPKLYAIVLFGYNHLLPPPSHSANVLYSV